MRDILLILTFFAALAVPNGATAQAVVLKADTVEVTCTDDTFLVSLRLRNFTNVAGLQFTLQWNPAHLDYAYVTQLNPVFQGVGFDTTTFIGQGKLTFAWTQLGGVSLPDNSVLFKVAFARIGGPATPVNFINDPTAIAVVNAMFEELPYIIAPGRVQPVDSILPYIACPANVTVMGTGPTPVPGIAPDSLSDNCGTPAVGWSSTGATTANFPNDPDASGALFNLGLSTVKYTATDPGGNTVTCSFTVTVEFAILTDDLTVVANSAAASCGQTVGIDVTAFNFDSIAGLQFSMGWDSSTLQYLSVTNFNPLLGLAAGNFGTSLTSSGILSFGWTSASLSGTTLLDGAVLFRINFTVQGSSNIAFSDNPTQRIAFTGKVFPPEEVPLVTVDGTVTVADTVLPTITCPANVTVQAPGSVAVQNIAPTNVADNCAPPDVGWSSTGATMGNFPNDPDASGAFFNIGTTTVTYTATDQGGNTATCSFTVTVEFAINTDELAVIANSVTVSCGQSFGINVTALNFDSIAGLQFSMGWDPALFQFTNVSNFNATLNLSAGNFGTAQTGLGILSFAWTSGVFTGTTLPDGAVLFTLNFNLVGNASSAITFGDNPTQRLAFTGTTSPPEEIILETYDGQVTVNDNVPPILECPDNVSVDAPIGSTSAQVDSLQPVALLDNCSGNVGLTYTQTGATTSSGTAGNANGIYNAGTTTVTYTATDLAGNTSTCSFTVFVDAGTPVTLTLDSISTGCQSGGAQIVVNLTVDNFTDLIGLQFGVNWDTAVLQFDTIANVFPGLNLTTSMFFNYSTTLGGTLIFFGASPSPWPTIPNGGIFLSIVFNVVNPNGTSALTFSGPFGAVNSSFQSVPVSTVNGNFSGGGADTAPPTITCPTNITTPAFDGCPAFVIIALPEVDDDCGIDTVTRVPAGNFFDVGPTTITYTATDLSGNTASCSMTVTIIDDAPPSVICPDSITTMALDGCTAFVNIPLPQAEDACSGIDTISRVPSGNSFVSGTTIVTYTVTDGSGNSATCSLTVRVLDSTVPFFLNCPASIVDTASGFACEAQVNWAPPNPTDACGQTGLVVTSNFTPDSLFPVGQTMVVYTVTDPSGSTGTCSFLVTIKDTVAPIIICPGSFTVPPDGYLADCAASVPFDLPIAFGACPLETLNISGNFAPNDSFPSGPTTVIYTATDGSGNEATCSFVITVLDNIPPVLTCPGDTVLVTAPDTCGAFYNYPIPTATDDCDATLTPTSLFTPGQLFPVGTTIVTYTATDQAGNTGTCSFTVTVTESVPPVIIDCPGDVPILLPPGICEAIAFWILPTAADNCALDTLYSSHASGDTFPAGTTVVTYTARDVAGNTTTCTFSVIAEDEIDPLLSNCPPNSPPISAGPCGIEVTWDPPTASDNCTPVANLVITSSHAPGDTFYSGTTNVVYYVEDASGNSDSCAFSITVTATQLPGFINVPVIDTIVGCSQPVSWTPPDEVGYCILADSFSTHLPGDTFPVGTTLVTYTWVEGTTGVQTSVTFPIVILENEPPAFTCPLGPIVVNVGGGIVSDSSEFLFSTDTVAGCAGVELDFDLPTATDNCGIDTLYESGGLPPGAVFPVGTNTLVFLATDLSGNTAQCSVVVEVQALPALNPVASPQLGCLNEPVTITATSIPGATYLWTFGQQMLNSTSNTHTIGEFATANEGTYTVSAVVNGCPAPSGSVSVELASEPNAVDDTGLFAAPDSTILFNVLDNDVFAPASDFDITFIGTVPGLVNLGNGNFSYTAVSNDTSFFYTICSKSCPELCDSAIVTIAVREPDEPCQIPNIITPNGDELNDFLIIDCIGFGQFRDNSLVIYNQWGDKVFETKGYNNNWGGTLNGEPGKDLPDGVYFYVFKPDSSVPTLKGFVEIFR